MELVRAVVTVGAPKTAGGPFLALVITIAVGLGLAWPRLPVLLRDPACWGRE
jgi:hypothetical protein